MRRVSTAVLPEPAPATINSGEPACTTASRCGGLRPWRSASDPARAGAAACGVDVALRGEAVPEIVFINYQTYRRVPTASQRLGLRGAAMANWYTCSVRRRAPCGDFFTGTGLRCP